FQSKHPVVVAVHDVERAARVHPDAVGLVESGLESGAAAAGEALLAGAGDANDLAFLGQVLADHVIGRVGDDDVVVAVHAQVLGAVERGLAGIAAVAGEAGLAGAGDRANLALGVHHAQGVAAALEDPDVAVAIGAGGTRIDQRAGLGVGAV